jgi:RHS repeat-associated protein
VKNMTLRSRSLSLQSLFRYYEKNLTIAEVTPYYYHGDNLVAKRAGTTMRYIHQDHLTGSSVVSGSAGALVNSIKYLPFGTARSGDLPTDKKFTWQRLDSTGLYYYNARYYDPTIGSFISPDTIVPNLIDPQSLNRFSYVLNNPLKYTDPSGHIVEFENEAFILASIDAMAQYGMSWASGSTFDHLLRKINQVVDFSFVDDLLKDRYTPDLGRPAEDPLFMLRLCLFQYL